MLEHYFVRPVTVDRIRASWLGPAIEQYVSSLAAQRIATRHVLRCVATLQHFGEFARARGAQTWDELPVHLEAFVAERMQARGAWCRSLKDQRTVRSQARTPVEQMLRLIQPGFLGTTRRITSRPFAQQVPGFWEYLEAERGLTPATLHGYAAYLRVFDGYLRRRGITEVAAWSPPVIGTFLDERARGRSARTVQATGGVLRVLLRYLHRERVLPIDLSRVIERRPQYRHATIPRSITSEQVRLVLAGIDRRAPLGKRDYAILLLLVTYGLRAGEVAALTLDDLDWKRERLRIRRRKAGHATTLPLSAQIGAVVLEYLQTARPETADRQLFRNVLAPFAPIRSPGISARAGHYLRLAGIAVPHPGAHTFRHTCVQHLVDADFSFKVIGDYVGHRSPSSTQIYGKVAVETLRDVALGDGEEVL
jgi:integrase/recombinase XerD